MAKVSPGMMRLLSSLLRTKGFSLDTRCAEKVFMRGRSNRLNGAVSGACATPAPAKRMIHPQARTKRRAHDGRMFRRFFTNRYTFSGAELKYHWRRLMFFWIISRRPQAYRALFSKRID